MSKFLIYKAQIYIKQINGQYFCDYNILRGVIKETMLKMCL